MKEFCYKISDPAGIHARPAGMLVRMAEGFSSNVTIEKGGKSVDLKKLIALMQLCVVLNDTVTVRIDGGDEETAFDSIKTFFENNL
ncbi:MAG: HPr family phosphocarrier protein [Huintestinicola sp.]